MEDDKEEEEEIEAKEVRAFLRREVGDWDDEEKARARFKALSGQRSDWEPLYLFWRNLIINVARHLRIFIIRPSRLNRLWFLRSGLSPLCLHQVLLEMHRAGDMLFFKPKPKPNPPSATATTLKLSHFFHKALNFFFTTTNHHDDDDTHLAADYYILAPLLEEHSLRVVNILSENHWTASCVITMTMFQDICLGPKEEALAILDYLSKNGRATLLTVKRARADDDVIEGVKICLAPGAVSSASSTDYSVLHLISTVEKLEKQLHLIDLRYEKTRNLALASLKSGNKRAALRYAKELKLESLSRERCTALLDRVEKVLQVITDAESSTKVSEAIKYSSHAIKANQISVEEVELCLQELYENIDSLKRLDNVLESTTAYAEIHDEDIEDEFDKLLLEIKSGTIPPKTGFDSSAGVAGVSQKTDALSNALSNLNIKDGANLDSGVECCVESVDKQSVSEETSLEAA